jgi:hypothetical protein
MLIESLPIPQHIEELVAELDRCMQSATQGGQGVAEEISPSIAESVIRAQLLALGWDAVFDPEQKCWVPIPARYTIIVSKDPGPYYYPQRCYEVPEAPDRWLTIWESKQEVRFLDWREAYLFVFAHRKQEQAHLPQKRFCVRPPGTWGGDEYLASSALEAEQIHRNYWLQYRWVTVAQAVSQPLEVFEHKVSGVGFYCPACQHAPCKYSKEQ